ncbi:MAG: NAD(P)/FAD-dependent oxidoreductase [Patescibacteria group bacterium]
MTNDNKLYDVIVIGAGPAGGQCARELAKAGRKVILLEHSQEIGQPNYSTAGTPRETIEEFDLPAKVLSATWNRIYFASTHEVAEWTYPETRGYVFDFAALKKFLAEDAARHGADTMVGAAATEFIKEGSNIVGLKYKGIFGEGELRAKYIVDATGHWGFANSFLKLNQTQSDDLASALELQLSGMPSGFEKTVALYFGKVAPQGYAWIFPMEESRACKIGIGSWGRLPNNTELKQLLRSFMGKFDVSNHLEPIEIHGGGGFISPGVKYHAYKNIIMIGDAASQVNPLAFEGIRHAFKTSQLAAKCIDQALKSSTDIVSLEQKYENEWRNLFGWRWNISYRIGKALYRKFTDEDLDKLMYRFQSVDPADAFEVFFNYRYELIYKYPKLALLFAKYLSF